MARPPIIISNGGIVDILTKGLISTEKEKVIMNIMELIKEEKEKGAKTKIYSIKIKKSGANAPKLYWRHKDDSKYEDNFKYYKEHDVWGKVFDYTMDGTEEGSVG